MSIELLLTLGLFAIGAAYLYLLVRQHRESVRDRGDPATYEPACSNKIEVSLDSAPDTPNMPAVLDDDPVSFVSRHLYVGKPLLLPVRSDSLELLDNRSGADKWHLLRPVSHHSHPDLGVQEVQEAFHIPGIGEAKALKNEPPRSPATPPTPKAQRL